MLSLMAVCGFTVHAGVILPGEDKPREIYTRQDVPLENAPKQAKSSEPTISKERTDEKTSQPPLQVGMRNMVKHTEPAMYSADVVLGEIPLQVHFENKKLQDVMEDVVNAVATRTGHWDLRWRLSPENRFLKDERVNLIAETNFGTFTSFVSERIKNMTGIQLYVNVFNGSRIIAITDSYY